MGSACALNFRGGLPFLSSDMNGFTILIGVGGIPGAGKSTAVLALARVLTGQGKRVTIVDADEGEEEFPRALGVAEFHFSRASQDQELASVMTPVPNLTIVPRASWDRARELPDEVLFRQLHGLAADIVIVDAGVEQCPRLMEACDIRLFIVSGQGEFEPTRDLIDRVLLGIAKGVAISEEEEQEIDRVWPEIERIDDYELGEAVGRNMRFAATRTVINRHATALLREELREFATDMSGCLGVDIGARMEMPEHSEIADLLAGRAMKFESPQLSDFLAGFDSLDVGLMRQRRRRDAAKGSAPAVNKMRTHRRARRPHACRLRYGEHELGGWVIDASVGGVLLRLPYDLEVGTVVDLRVGACQPIDAVVVRAINGRVAFQIKDEFVGQELVDVLEDAYETAKQQSASVAPPSRSRTPRAITRRSEAPPAE